MSDATRRASEAKGAASAPVLHGREDYPGNGNGHVRCADASERGDAVRRRDETVQSPAIGPASPHDSTTTWGGRSIDALGRAAAWCLQRILSYPALAFAILVTGVFYYPSLRNGCRDAGFLYGGDVLGFYWPYIAKLQSLLSRHHFVALDFGQFNASADFFLAANFFPCHPLFVAWALCTRPEAATFQEAGRILVWAVALHSFIACYFSIRLLTRFFGLQFWQAAFAAAAFAFSVYAVDAHGEPMYVFCGSVLPWAAYAALDYQEGRGFRRLVLAAFPVLVGYLAGYVPLGVACLGIAAVLVGIKLLLLSNDTLPLETRLSQFLTALLPFVAGTFVAAPYLLAVFFFLKASPSASTASLFFSAHQLAEVPQSILRMLSYRAPIPGPFHEFSVTWGVIAIAVAALFLLSSRTLESLSQREWTLLKAAGLIYFTIVLSIFGQHSVVSDMVFYFVPQVGGMHIYQRFLLPGQLLFGVMMALMLKAVIDARPVHGLRIAFVVFTAACFTAAFVVIHFAAPASGFGLNNYVVFELLLGALCMGALLVPDSTFAYIATLALFTLPALDVMYDRSQGGSTFDEQRKRHGVMLNESLRDGVIAYLTRFRRHDEQLLKYVDITPRWSSDGVEYFPKAFPHFVLQEAQLSPYSGWNFYLSSRADYMRTIPYAADGRFHPDWERLRITGADFVVALESDLPKLEPLTGALLPADIHKLPNGVVIAPLWQGRAGSTGLYDNGYVRITRDVVGVGERMNLAFDKSARQSSEGGGDASRAVDGNTSGVFAAGSVTHTGNEVGAWLEIDLGSTQPIGSVRVWNRSEAPHRLSDFWLIIADEPVPASAAPRTEAGAGGAWRRRIGITPQPSLTIDAAGAVGRYVRIQLANPSASPDNILSLAEVQVFALDEKSPAAPPLGGTPPSPLQVSRFASNDANAITLEAETTEPLVLQYLLWNNPRLRYAVNGARVLPEIRDGVATLRLPRGRNVITIQYHNRTLTIFWIVYACYTATVAWVLLTRAMDFLRTTQRTGLTTHSPT
jgi:hypothetical protein